MDLDRVYASGMSAGGLWTSYLTLHEAQWLAATAPLSGGADAFSYDTPAEPNPVMITWGGPTDIYGGYSFDDASLYLSGALQKDGVASQDPRRPSSQPGWHRCLYGEPPGTRLGAAS